MMDIDIKGLVPRFIWNDVNGHALCKAIETGMKMFLDIAGQGVETWGDPENMPEWRLDEMAWEYNIPYDYTADVDIKRRWIANAYDLSRLYGTAAGVEQYLQGYFDDAELQEASEYSGDPYHFRINLAGEYTAARAAWVSSAVDAVKNVRSVLDGVHYEMTPVETTLSPFVGIGLYNVQIHEFPAQEQPDIDAEEWLVDESEIYLVNEWGVALTL